ncbi:spore cortex-lytic enzyme [Chryseomicrobium sp. FSL W7-1435]|uniref:spore cortex-lytic enzyme n=1 Tax=Chryseomicrobium sp. FSL W7-1435 TaxID=2921704 RepID=UPI00315AAF90
MKKMKWWLATIVCLFILSIGAGQSTAFTNQNIVEGNYGDNVIELQARLQYLGFYHGEIDGHFGKGTSQALQQFQKQYGLPVDGVAGAATRKKLEGFSDFDYDYVHSQIKKGVQFTYYGNQPLDQQVKGKTRKPSTAQLPPGYTDKELQLLANAVYGEARGEPYEGQVAVAAVILNRIESPQFPNTVSEVIFQPRAFTAVDDGQIWLTPNERAKEAVIDAINGWDPTENALYYFNPVTATSEWIWTRPQIKTIGKHIFCE